MSHSVPTEPDALRRRLLLAAPALGLAAPGALQAQTASRPAQAGEVRLALLLGNRTYVKDYDLPPIPKNLRDLRGALELCGFTVTDALDLDLVRSQAAVASFSQQVRAAPADATIFFYFCGHGMQDDEAKNLLVSAGVNVAEVNAVKKGSLKLDSDVVNPLAPRSAGATFAVIDACRVSVFNQARGEKGLNQVEAPPGCLIAFSTAAGKPALAPAVDTQNTFYTASLVKVIGTVTEETTFADLFRLVKRDVRQTMLTHPVSAVRALAQDPFIADYTHASVYVLPRRLKVAGSTSTSRPAAPDEETAWQRIQQSIWPPEVAQLGDAFLSSYPTSKFAPSVEIARDGASDAARILRRDDIKLFRNAFKPREELGAQYQEDLTRAARGDKDAAARVAKVYRTDESRGPTLGRYEGWLQYAAALGNGIASYDLALLYRKLGQPDPSARFEARALELGYTPPAYAERLAQVDPAAAALRQGPQWRQPQQRASSARLMSSLPPNDDDKDRTVIRPPAGGRTAVTLAASTGNVESDNALPPGTWLGEFEITGVLGEGGFGIVYLALDHSLERHVALKEYMPSALAARRGGTDVQVKSERHRDTFEAGLRSFVNEAKLLAQFDHPSLVKVYRFWEANGTAYMVMPYYQGITLKEHLRQLPGPPDEAWLMGLLAPLTEALAVMHAENCFHRDISPDNVILLAGSGKPLLLDFGAARRVIGDMTQALTVILKPGYAPVEQYAESPGMKQGPWTDVYALAASVHFAILGRTPPPSVGRLMGDSHVPLAEAASRHYSARFLQAIDQALQLRPEQRTQSIAALRADLGLVATTTEPPLRSVAARAPQDDQPTLMAASPAPVDAAPGRRRAWLGGAGALLLGGAALYFTQRPAPAPIPAPAPAPAPVEVVASAAGSSPEPASAPVAAPPPPSPALAVAREFERLMATQTPGYTVTAMPAKSRLRIGRDLLQFTVRSAQEGYLHVFVLGPDGTLMLLYPNAMAPRNRIRAGQTLTLPQSSWLVDTLPPTGPEQVLAVVSKVPRDLAALRSKRGPAVLELPVGAPGLLGVASGCNGADCEEFGAAAFTVEVVRP